MHWCKTVKGQKKKHKTKGEKQSKLKQKKKKEGSNRKVWRTLGKQILSIGYQHHKSDVDLYTKLSAHVFVWCELF